MANPSSTTASPTAGTGLPADLVAPSLRDVRIEPKTQTPKAEADSKTKAVQPPAKGKAEPVKPAATQKATSRTTCSRPSPNPSPKSPRRRRRTDPGFEGLTTGLLKKRSHGLGSEWLAGLHLCDGMQIMWPPPLSETPQEFEVKPRTDGKRIDAYLASRFTDYSRAVIQRVIDAEAVLVNGRTVKASYRVRAGDRVCIRLPELPDMTPDAGRHPDRGHLRG